MLGASEETVRKRRKVAEAVGTDTLGQIVGSSLDSPAELAALADMPEPQRHELVERAASELPPAIWFRIKVKGARRPRRLLLLVFQPLADNPVKLL